MQMKFDGYRETFLTDYCLNENGKRVLRDDYETAEECREAYRRERIVQRRRIDLLTFMALGMLVALLMILIGR